MQRVYGNTITLTRGDTFKANIVIKKAGEVYVPQEDDVIRFAMKKKYTDAAVLIEKEIQHDTLLLQIDPQDTASLDFGPYVYDIQMTYANGDVDTFIANAILNLTEEVD